MVQEAQSLINLADVPLYRVRGRRATSLVLRAENTLTYADSEKVWCHYWNSGRRVDLAAKDLIPLPLEQQPSDVERRERMVEWAGVGSSDALWWLGWWYSGMKHCRSTWYYIAALRKNPKAHGWALDRIISDTLSGCMCAGQPVPSIAFAWDIPEFKTGRIATDIDWRQAADAAKSAVETVVTTEQVDAMFAMMLDGVHQKIAGWRAGVPTNNLHKHAQWATYEAERERKWAEQLQLQTIELASNAGDGLTN